MKPAFSLLFFGPTLAAAAAVAAVAAAAAVGGVVSCKCVRFVRV